MQYLINELVSCIHFPEDNLRIHVGFVLILSFYIDKIVMPLPQCNYIPLIPNTMLFVSDKFNGLWLCSKEQKVQPCKQIHLMQKKTFDSLVPLNTHFPLKEIKLFFIWYVFKDLPYNKQCLRVMKTCTNTHRRQFMQILREQLTVSGRI